VCGTGLEIGAHHVTLVNIMSFEYPNLKHTVAAIAAIVMFSLPLAGGLAAQEADLNDENALLVALAQADTAEAKRLERQLLALWRKSGSPSMDLLLKRGRDALDASDIPAAIQHLTALTDHAPDFAEGWHMRASAYFEAGLYGPALADLERALQLNPYNYNAIIGLGAIFETFGDPVRAYEAYLRAQAIHPRHEEVGKALARLKSEVEGKAL
jgi:tetratricopeptide (TPR) repeat protein